MAYLTPEERFICDAGFTLSFVIELRGNGGSRRVPDSNEVSSFIRHMCGRRHLIKLIRWPVAGAARPGVKDFRMCRMLYSCSNTHDRLADSSVPTQLHAENTIKT